nr:DNRLRE domain-containing protein [Microbacterium immunditiarum]
MLVGAISATATAPASAVDEYDELRAKLQNLLLGADEYTTPITDSDLLNKITAMDRAVSSCASPCNNGSGWWDSMNRDAANRTYLWLDQPFSASDGATLSRNMTASYSRLYPMITVYYTPGSQYFGNTTLLNDVVAALDWLFDNYYGTNPANDIPGGGWYDYQIGTPQVLTKIVTLMYDDLTPAQIANYMGAVERFTPTPQARTLAGSPIMTGTNLIDQALVVAFRGILVEDGTKLASARDSIGPVLAYVDPATQVGSSARDGFYEDGSFIQHTWFSYIGGYGVRLLYDVGVLLYILDGSTWAITDPNKVNAYRWITDSVEPFIYDTNIMDMTFARNNSFGVLGNPNAQPPVTAAGIIHALGMLMLSAPSTGAGLGSGYPSDPEAYYNGMVKYWLSKDADNKILAGAPLFTYFQFKQIIDDPSVSPRGELIKYKQFPAMDRAVHLRPGYGYGLSMSSNRTGNYESGNLNNVHGWYTGDGMTYLYDADARWQGFRFWETVNPYRMPGTTIDTQARTNTVSWKNYVSPNSWVGGTDLDGVYGVTGMDYLASGDLSLDGKTVATPSNLTAKKSWFMFDDEVVDLGGGITNSGQTGNGWDGALRRVETIIHNRKLNADGSNTITFDGTAFPTTLGTTETIAGANWFHVAGSTSGSSSSVGYYLPTATTIQATREARRGSLADINLALPTVYTIKPADDVYARENDPNHGIDPTLVVKNDGGGYTRETYLKFNLSGKVPSDVTFDSAVITLYPNTVGSTSNTITHTIELVSDTSWSESTLVWDNKPPSTALDPIVQWNVNSSQVNTPIQIDVTDALENALASHQSDVAFRIHASSPVDPGSTVTYSSRDSVNSQYHPTLTFNNYREYSTSNFATMWIDHGTNPTNANYGYVVLPGRSSTEVQQYAANPEVDILENSTSAQAVRENTLNAVGVNFWQDATKTVQVAGQDYLTVDRKASVMTREANGVLDLSISDPTQQNTGVVHVEVNRSAPGGIVSLDPGIAVTQFSPTIQMTVNVSGTHGKALKASFDLGSPTVPDAPVLDTPSFGDGTVTLNWANVNDATGYQVKYGTLPGTYTTTVPAESVSSPNRHTVTGLTNGTPYYFAVVASSAAGESVISNEQGAVPNRMQHPSVTLGAAADAHIQDGASAETNFGTSKTMTVKNDGVGFSRRSFVRFDLSSITGAITSAQVQLVPTTVGMTGITNQANLVLDNTWNETALTWNNQPAASATAIASWTVPEPGAPVTFDVTAEAQEALGVGGDNMISVLVSSPTNQGSNASASYGSRENSTAAYRPVLVVNPSNPHVSVGATADAFVRDGTYADTNYGADQQLYVKNDGTGYSRRAFVKFDLAGVTGGVTSATLRLVPTSTGAAGLSNQAYSVSDPNWSESILTWRSQPAGVTMVGSWTVPTAGTPVELDVTEQVRIAVANDSLLSIQLLSPTNQGAAGYVNYASKENPNTLYRPELVIN